MGELTTNEYFYKPDFKERGYDDEFNAKLDNVDAVLAQLVADASANESAIAAEIIDRAKQSMALNAVALGCVVDTGADQRANIVSAISAAVTAKRPLFFPPGVYTKAGAAIPLPSNVELFFAPGAVIKNADGTHLPVLTNSDTTNGNTGIKIHGGLFDGNRGGTSEDAFFSTLDFTKLTFSLFEGCHVRGGARQAAGSSGNGEGLVLRDSHHNEIRGGKYYENDYDGIKLRASNYNTITGVVFYNNERSAVQLAYPGSPTAITEANKSHHNTITGCTVFHTTGVVGGGGADASDEGSPYVSGFGLHAACDNTISGNTVYGTACGVDFLEGAHRNVITDNTFACRPITAVNDAIINIRNWNDVANHRNIIMSNELYGIAGASKRFIWADYAQGNLIAFNTFARDSDATSGTWLIESTDDSGSNRYILNNTDSNAVTITLAEVGPTDIWGGSGSLSVNTKAVSAGAGGGRGVIALGNAQVAPTSNPSGGGIIYFEGGVLKIRTPSGIFTVDVTAV